MKRAVQVPIVAAVVTAGATIVAAFVGNWGGNDDPSFQPSPAATQVSSAANSPNVANVQGDVRIHIVESKSQLDIPSFDGSLVPLPGARRDSSVGAAFNDFMLEHGEETVYLSLYLSEKMIQDVSRQDEEYGRRIFTVQDDLDDLHAGGNEYLIHLPEQGPKSFDFNPRTGRLAGYFKVWDINGPRYGYTSVNLRPVKGK